MVTSLISQGQKTLRFDLEFLIIEAWRLISNERKLFHFSNLSSFVPLE